MCKFAYVSVGGCLLQFVISNQKSTSRCRCHQWITLVEEPYFSLAAMDERAPLLQDDELLASRSSALNGSHGPKPSKGVYQHVTINTPAEVHLESIQWKVVLLSSSAAY